MNSSKSSFSKKLIFILLCILVLAAGFWAAKTNFFNQIQPQQISENGFQGTYFNGPEGENKTAVIIPGGGESADFWAHKFAKAGHAGLSLPYHRLEGLPEQIEEIPLEYFEKAIDWLASQPQINPEKIVIMGASTNAELALLIGASFPEKVSGVIAYCPSSVAWSNTVFPWSSEEIKSKWTLRGETIPCIAMEKIKGGESNLIETIPYWNSGLDDTSQVENAMIPVEKINGPILLLTPEDDKVWPSLRMSKMIVNRLKENDFPHAYENITYPDAGHTISAQYSKSMTVSRGQMWIGDKSYEFEFGGTPEGILAAQMDSRDKVMEFVESL